MPMSRFARARIHPRQHVYRIVLLTCLLAVLLPALAGLARAQGEQANAWTVTRLNLRADPGTGAAVLATLDANTGVVLEGRSADTTWVLVHTPGGALRGWLSVGYLRLLLGFDLGTLPISTASGAISGGVVGSPAAVPLGDGPVAYALFTLNVREGPGQSYARLGQLPAQAQVVLEARSPDATWVVGHTPGGTLRGWLAAGYLLVDHAALEALPVSTEPVASLPVGGGEAAAPTTPITTQAIIDVSLSTEALAHARELFAAGQALGNQPDSFIAIGDSAVGGNVDTLPMFHSIVNRTYELGDYAYLQHTIDYFSRTFSFYVERGTARAGNGTINILDPLLADPALCEPGENALACEIRRQHPGVALVYIGFVDLSVSTVEQYAANLDTILQQCMASGVIPVLTTLTASRSTLAGYNNVERFDAMNNAIRGFAAGYALPLIDLQVAAAGLPNQGTRTNDGVHLSYSAAGQVSFAGDQHRYGSDLRELLTLLMLDTLRINVLGG